MAAGRVVEETRRSGEDIDGWRRWREGDTIVIAASALASMSVSVSASVSLCMTVMAEVEAKGGC